MFEELDNKNDQAPKNLPTEPLDMFEGVDGEGKLPDPVMGGEKIQTMPDALSAGLLKKKEEPPNPLADNLASDAYQMKEPVLGKILLVVVLGVLITAVALGVWYLLGKKDNSEDLNPNIQKVEEEKTSVTETQQKPQTDTADITTGIKNDNILFGEQVDTDGDGLDDLREDELGTKKDTPDTDGDELRDGDEVVIWKTSPLNPDTDGDTYPDGHEIKNGYNPLGPGKLFDLPSASTTK